MKNMVKSAVLAALSATTFGAFSVQAASVTVPLGTIHTGDDIGNYFNGGTDSTGEGPGQNLGIAFSANATAQASGDSARTGDGKFENNPSGQSEVVAFAFSNATAAYINDAAGFSSLSFNYSFSNNTNATGTAENAYVYSGVNGTGTLLDTLALTPAALSVACKSAGDAYCTWSAATTGIANFGTAESVIFAGSPTAVTTGNPTLLTEFDGISLTPVPLPATLWLMIGGVGGFAGFARRRRLI